MSRAQFDEFIRKQTARASSEQEFDREAEITSWLSRVENLYETVTMLLADYVSAGSIVIYFEEMSLYEEALGSYQGRALILKVGLSSIRFEPVGRFIFGARGRVDIVGQNDRRKLVFVEANAKRVRVSVTIVDENAKPTPRLREPDSTFAWKFITDPPSREFRDLTQDSLMAAIVEVTGG